MLGLRAMIIYSWSLALKRETLNRESTQSRSFSVGLEENSTS
jgi:hypothetical protein